MSFAEKYLNFEPRLGIIVIESLRLVIEGIPCLHAYLVASLAEGSVTHN